MKNEQTFGSKSYPAEMRRQLWPLCCGAAIISGFKDVHSLTEDQLVDKINDIIKNQIPDMQVFGGETICPKLTFLTLNQGQTASPKLMAAVKKSGFELFATGQPRGSVQSFFVRDDSKTFKLVA